MNTIINVNGRQYDSRTGKMLGKVPDSSSSDTQKTRTLSSNATMKPGVILDGVSKPKAFMPEAKTVIQPSNSLKTRKIAPLTGARSLDIKPVHNKTQKTNTLQRSAVIKPVKNAPVIHSTSSIVKSKVEHSATGRGLLIKRVPDSRLARAKQTVKSNVVHKFNANPISAKPILSNSLTVAKAPINTMTTRTANAVRSLQKPMLGRNANNNQQKVFEHPSIANATAHNNPKVPKSSRIKLLAGKFQISPKIAGSIAAVLAIVILGSFFMYQKVPAIAMRVAANQAGFNGRFPGDTPSGFTFKGPIKYTKGNISISFASSTDQRNFVITQKPTDQTSESLLVSEISPSKRRYQTYHDRGLTVFIYNDGSATWVDKGILYNIKDNGALSSEQILTIAGSM